MKSLLIAPALPNDSGNGLAMRIGVFLEALCRLGEVELVVLPIFDAGASSNRFCGRLDVLPTLIPTAGRAETHFKLLRQVADPRARLDAFREYGKPSSTAFLSLPVLDDLRQWLNGRRFDLVHVARSYMLPALAALNERERPKVSVDLDEDDAKVQHRFAALHRQLGNLSAADWLDAEAAAFERMLARHLSDVDIAFISTEADRETLRTRNPAADPIVVENAVSVPPLEIRERHGSELLFVGGFGYFPNVDAATWLLEAIVPRLQRVWPGGLTLTIVGRNPPDDMQRRAQSLGVNLLDSVEDLTPIYSRADVALVPLRAGGGSRIKLLEAAAHGVPIVTTTIGAEGTRMRDGEEVWLADTTTAIVDTIGTVLRCRTEAARRSSRARACVQRFHSRQRLISALCQTLSEVCATGVSKHDI